MVDRRASDRKVADTGFDSRTANASISVCPWIRHLEFISQESQAVRVGKITCFSFNYNFNYNHNEKILKTLQLIYLHTKPRVFLMSTLWICFVFLYQTYQSHISPWSYINLCLTLIFSIPIFLRSNCQVYYWIYIASSNIMVLAKPWYHTAIICAKENKF